jgi:histidine ammonia-lyase
VIAGQHLALADVVRVARTGASVRLDPDGLERARAAHALIMRLAESGAPLYGGTTGSGANRTIRIPPEEFGAFQVHLITSQCVGVGPPLPADVTRAAYKVVREVAGFLDEDRSLAPEVEQVRELVIPGKLLARVDSAS